MLAIDVTKTLIFPPIPAPNSFTPLAKGVPNAREMELQALLATNEAASRGTLDPVPRTQDQGKAAFAPQNKADAQSWVSPTAPLSGLGN